LEVKKRIKEAQEELEEVKKEVEKIILGE